MGYDYDYSPNIVKNDGAVQAVHSPNIANRYCPRITQMRPVWDWPDRSASPQTGRVWVILVSASHRKKDQHRRTSTDPMGPQATVVAEREAMVAVAEQVRWKDCSDVRPGTFTPQSHPNSRSLGG